MTKGLHDERIGLAKAALLIGCRISDLREAVAVGHFDNGATAPLPLQYAGARREPLFRYGDVVACGEAFREASRQNSSQ